MQDLARKFKEEVAEAAISLFKRNGYNNVTVNEICKECGISRSVFYSSFNGKRSILEYMVEKPQHNDDASFMKFAHADNDFERIWQLFDRFIAIAYDFGPELTSTLFIMQFESPEGIRAAVHALDDLFATLATNCAKSGIIDSKEPPDLLSRIATDLICHELYVWCSQKGNFSLRARARQYYLSITHWARRSTSRCAHARGSTPRSPTTSSRSIACRPSSATRCDCKSPLPGTPAQPRLILGQNEESAHILLRKKPAARHLFQPLVFSFVSIINVQTNRLPQNSKLRSKSAIRSR